MRDPVDATESEHHAKNKTQGGVCGYVFELIDARTYKDSANIMSEDRILVAHIIYSILGTILGPDS